ncbi:MAG TPA: phenazine biosynthesis protein PhzC/PhzF, partial [Noviherbaspirillum sp.]|nr:phenazine biosynthesis protein PhzC/PhzF [Noviherbaspirillum sp.]
MARYGFRIVNVFAESTFGGNPLCVFEDGRGITD